MSFTIFRKDINITQVAIKLLSIKNEENITTSSNQRKI